MFEEGGKRRKCCVLVGTAVRSLNNCLHKYMILSSRRSRCFLVAVDDAIVNGMKDLTVGRASAAVTRTTTTPCCREAEVCNNEGLSRGLKRPA